MSTVHKIYKAILKLSELQQILPDHREKIDLFLDRLAREARIRRERQEVVALAKRTLEGESIQ